MNDLAVIVPDPSPMLDVRSVCSTVVLWAESTDDVVAIADNSAKLAAIATYVAQTNRDGLAEIEAARRRLEMRIGELSPRHQGQPTCSDPEQVPRWDRSRFRQMFENADVVEEIIAESTDDQPPTRNRVIEARARAPAPRPPGTGPWCQPALLAYPGGCGPVGAHRRG